MRLLPLYISLSIFAPTTLVVAGTAVFFSPQGGCEKQARLLVDGAKSSLDIAVYSLNSPTIIAAIEAAIKRGVQVRVLTDRTQAFGHGNKTATQTLATATTDFRVHSKNRIMHNKFAIADNRQLMTGSFNWTRSAEQSNDENCLVIDEPATVDSYKLRFNTHLWVKNTGEKSREILNSKGITQKARSLAGGSPNSKGK